jgi:putative transposase
MLIRDHLPGHVAQTAATRAFNAILQYAFGKRGRPKFRHRDRYNSFESKEARSTIIWRDGAVRIAGRVIPAILDLASAWQSEALKAKTKYCRIIRRDIRGRERWYVQLVQEGLTPLRRETKRGVVGPNIGPSTIAVVAHTEAIFEQFRPSVIQPWGELRRIERAMDRSKRANNPQCFDEKGRWKKGAKMRVRSKRYQARKRRERERCLAAERRRSHGELANRILGNGTTVKTEKLSYKAWQRQRYGKSTKVRSPAAFVNVLRNKIRAARGELIEFGTRNSAFPSSATCVARTRKSRCLSGITSCRTGRASGGMSIPPFLPVSSWITVSMRSRPRTLGQVRKRSCEWRRTDSNLRAGRALPFLTHSWRQSGSLDKIPCQSPRGWG